MLLTKDGAQMTMISDLPYIEPRLLKRLDKKFPEAFPEDMFEDPREYDYRAGQRSVIEWMKRISLRQEDNLEDY